MATVRAFVTNL